jgi:hypothetical protein
VSTEVYGSPESSGGWRVHTRWHRSACKKGVLSRVLSLLDIPGPSEGESPRSARQDTAFTKFDVASEVLRCAEDDVRGFPELWPDFLIDEDGAGASVAETHEGVRARLEEADPVYQAWCVVHILAVLSFLLIDCKGGDAEAICFVDTTGSRMSRPFGVTRGVNGRYRHSMGEQKVTRGIGP